MFPYPLILFLLLSFWSRVSQPSTIGTWGEMLLSCGGAGGAGSSPVHSGMLSSNSGLYPADAVACPFLLVMPKNVSTY